MLFLTLMPILPSRLQVLCSVDSVPAVLDEARRVLRHGAPFLFIEHVVAPAGQAAAAHRPGARRSWQPPCRAAAVPGICLLLHAHISCSARARSAEIAQGDARPSPDEPRSISLLIAGLAA